MKETKKSKLFVLQTGEYSIGLYYLNNGQLSHVQCEKSIKHNRTFWKATLYSPMSVNGHSDFRDVFFERHPEYSRNHYNFVELHLVPGQIYPRVYRPILKYNPGSFLRSPHDEIQRLEEEINQTFDYLPHDGNVAQANITQLSSLVEILKGISRVVRPTADNLQVYGDEIRSLLILACTEVESHLRAILNANSLVVLERPNTSDYVKLKAPLKLDNYRVSFALFPWLSEFRPFEHWDAKSATQSLSWYDAYNSVKHNNEEEYNRATLESVLNSVSAVAIMLTAQYGTRVQFWNELIGSFFSITQPSWETNDYYFPPIENGEWIKGKLFDN